MVSGYMHVASEYAEKRILHLRGDSTRREEITRAKTGRRSLTTLIAERTRLNPGESRDAK